MQVIFRRLEVIGKIISTFLLSVLKSSSELAEAYDIRSSVKILFKHKPAINFKVPFN
jgi:hypothetical protein